MQRHRTGHLGTERQIKQLNRPAPVRPAPTAAETQTASPTPAETVSDLEILEWEGYLKACLADPQNTETRVETLIRSPNEFPVGVSMDGVELGFLTSAGEIA